MAIARNNGLTNEAIGLTRMNRHHQLTTSIPEQAAEWVIELSDSGLDESRRREFMGWLRTSPQHIEEFLAIAVLQQEVAAQPVTVTDILDDLRRAGASAPESLFSVSAASATASSPPGRRKRSWQVLGWLTAASVAVAALLLTQLTGTDAPLLRHSTGLGEQRSVALEDGSILTLNTLTEVTVRMDRSTREVTLLAGEAMFDVVPDRQRPFVVDSGPVSLNVVGTRFSVYRQEDQVRLAVVNGAVQVVANDRLADGIEVRGGEGLIASRNGIALTGPGFDIETAIAWTDRRLIFDGAPLAEVVSEFNRYNPVPVIVEDAELAGRAVTTVFNAHDADALIAFLELEPDVEVAHDDDAIRIRAKR